MVPLSCALDMMLLWISATISLGLMALSLSLGAPGAPKIPLSPPNVWISSILTLVFDISAVYGPIGLCFGYDAPVGLCFHISRAHGPIT